MDKKLLAAAGGAALVMACLPARAVDIKVGGHVNRAIMFADDGSISKTHNVDGATSGTRFGFSGDADVRPGLKAGLEIEAGFQSNPADDVTQATPSVAPTLDERVMEVFLKGAMGKLSLGQGDGAANSGIQVDLSGTGVVTGTLSHNLGESLAFKTSDGMAIGNATIGRTLNNQDFESRYDRVRYDTPAFGPFGFAVSQGTKSNFAVQEIAGRYRGDLGALGRLAAAVGYSVQDTATPGFDNKTIGGSASWLSALGFSVTVAYSKQDLTSTRKGDYKYGKIGYKWAKHAVSTDYTVANDQNVAGDKASRVMFGYVYNLEKWAELYSGYHINRLNRPGVSAENIKIFAVGARFKF